MCMIDQLYKCTSDVAYEIHDHAFACSVCLRNLPPKHYNILYPMFRKWKQHHTHYLSQFITKALFLTNCNQLK